MAGSIDKLFGAIVAIFLITILAMPQLTSFAQTDSSPVFSPDSEPYGMTYGGWTAEWWKWFISMPTDENVINDPTGEKCASKQGGPVWYLVGSGGGKAERSCVVPAGKAILIPAINVECSKAEDQTLETEAQLAGCATDDQNLVTQARGNLDELQLEVHRVQSQQFDVMFPANNIFGASEGPTQAVSEGYWIFLKPLPPGDYELHVDGLLVDYTVTGPVNLVEDSTYHLTVKAPPTFTTFTETVSVADESISLSLGSSSNVSNVSFDEQAKQLSFKVTGENGIEGITTIPISRLLEGPYTVMVDGVTITDYGIYMNQRTSETTITIVYNHSTRDITITGTNVVPEFPYSLLILLAAIGTAVLFGRTGFIKRPYRYEY